ncbi:hypothetical protein IFM89_038346 [Coptis chinensis]|uniref:Protein kinase domain-containing protein n=1 Tax=Coptis chinensis TaxID=261450 RepID=A0A835LXR0_9MAGN|nr:hypothetical protein IFM89_038346 [Coptis chinensis]
MVAFVGFIIILLWFCLSHNKSISRTSETAWLSSDPSFQGKCESLILIDKTSGRNIGIELSLAEGLAHLHAITPILVYKNFKTTNVFVDENFIAKVADVGLRNLTVPWAWINAPSEYALALRHFVLSWALVKEFGRFSDRSDVSWSIPVGVSKMKGMVASIDWPEIPKKKASRRNTIAKD